MRRAPHVREYEKRHYQECKTQLDAKNREWAKKHPERRRAIKRSYYHRHKEEIRIKVNEKRANNPFSRKGENSRRTKLHPEKSVLYSQCRRVQKRGLPSAFTEADWQHALSYFNNCCAYCDRPRGLWHTLAQDHFVPITKGGGYTPGNVLPACHGVGGCNNSKGARDPIAWLTEYFGPKKAKSILARIQSYFDNLMDIRG